MKNIFYVIGNYKTMKKEKEFKDVIHDIKINPLPFFFGFILGLFFSIPIALIQLTDFSPPAWKTLEKDIANDMFTSKKLLQYSATDEETAIIQELLSKQEELKNIIPQDKKERKDFVTKYKIEMDVILSQYKKYLFENYRW